MVTPVLQRMNWDSQKLSNLPKCTARRERASLTSSLTVDLALLLFDSHWSNFLPCSTLNCSSFSVAAGIGPAWSVYLSWLIFLFTAPLMWIRISDLWNLKDHFAGTLASLLPSFIGFVTHIFKSSSFLYKNITLPGSNINPAETDHCISEVNHLCQTIMSNLSEKEPFSSSISQLFEKL